MNVLLFYFIITCKKEVPDGSNYDGHGKVIGWSVGGVIFGVAVVVGCCIFRCKSTKQGVEEASRESPQINLPTCPAQTSLFVSNDFVNVPSAPPQKDIQMHPVLPEPPIDTSQPPALPPPTYDEAIQT